MLSKLLQVVRPLPGRSIPNYTRYLTNMRMRSDSLVVSRLLGQAEVESAAFNLLRQLLGLIDVQRSLPLDDYSTFTKVVVPQATMLRKLFDPVYRQDIRDESIFSNAQFEYIINTSSKNPLLNLPMNQPWEQWENVRSSWILYHSGNQLVSNVLRYTFKFDDPKSVYAVISIDSEVTAMKYIKYAKRAIEMGVRPDPYAFIKTEIFLPYYEDFRRIWTTNLLIHGLRSYPDKSIKSYYDVFSFDPVLSPANDVGVAYGQITDTIEMVANNRLKPEAFFNTVFLADNYTLLDWMRVVEEDIEIPELRQYYPMKYAFELPLVWIFLKVIDLYGPMQYTQITRQLQRIAERLEYSKPFANTMYSPQTQRDVTAMFDEAKTLMSK